MADSMGTKEASEIWGWSQSSISKWCRDGLVKGATQDAPGSPWHIPKDAKCPKELRLRSRKEASPRKKKEIEKNGRRKDYKERFFRSN